MEVSTIKGSELTDDIQIKVNLYDAQGVIIYSDEIDVEQDDFSGYDTLHFYLNENNLAYDAAKARLFAVRS